MDLNSLLFRHQLSLMRADAAPSAGNRSVHVDDAEGWAVRIHDLQHSMGAATPLVRAACPATAD